MTTGALILFVGFVIVVCLFGLYAGFHRESDVKRKD
jgi:hypothetical protein